MLFTEPTFLFLFLPLLLGAYFAAPVRWRNAVLLAASLYFYAAGEGIYVALMLASSAANYGVGLALDAAPGARRRKGILVVGVAVNLGLLAVFKYAGFVVSSVNLWLAAAGWGTLAVPRLHLPIGISFFTFQAISYIVDVYRREVTAQRRPTRLALYIMLFPQLIAGPIVRYASIAEQLVVRRVTSRRFVEGCRRFVIGLAKKMLVANGVAAAADAAFALPYYELTTAAAWLGVVCYSIQIYFDFSGYSDMAIGLGLMFGFRFPENFRHPYAARSITEFWRRWHITLSTWFRDYLYIPLGGNRAARPRVLGNLLVVFLLCGLWHGASWTFVVWGLLHGMLLIVERLGLERWLSARGRLAGHAYVLLAMAVTWTFFRAGSIEEGVFFAAALAGRGGAAGGLEALGSLVNPRLLVVIALGVVGSTPLVAVAARRWREHVASAARPGLAARMTGPLATAALALVFLASLVMVAAETHNPFLYFRF
ncbi:MAG TPA: MBOAT family O-acyltransferase [Gemmatimonadaceae bacterium]